MIQVVTALIGFLVVAEVLCMGTVALLRLWRGVT